MESILKYTSLVLSGQGSRLPSLLLRWLRMPRVWVGISIAIVILSHWPHSRMNLVADDYLLWAQLNGSPTLVEKGFTLSDPQSPLLLRLRNAFHFYSDAQGTNEVYHRYGNLPWWSSRQALMHPFRPMAAFTHWLDFEVLASNAFAMGTLNLLAILLLWSGVYLLFRHLTQSVALACIMALFLVSDTSVSTNFNWLAARNSYLATGLGALALWHYIMWRESRLISRLFAALFFYSVSLLTAEASIALLGYFGAFALIMENNGKLRGLLATLPFLLVTVIWRIIYNLNGFGSDNIGLYVDPGRGVVDFLAQAFAVFPCIVTGLATGIDSMTASFGNDLRWWVRLFAWGFTLMCLYPIRYVLVLDNRARFMLLGSVIAVIPHTSLLSEGSRSATFVALGFFYVLVLWIKTLWDARVLASYRAWLASFLVGWHLVLPALFMLFFSAGLVLIKPFDEKLFEASSAQISRPQTNTSETTAPDTRALVVINPPVPTTLFYIPFEWSYLHRPVPDNINVFAPGMTPLSVTRESETVFIVKSNRKMAVNHTVDLRDENSPVMHNVHAYQLLQGLITSPRQRYESNSHWYAGNLKITPLQVEDGIPLVIRVEFIDKSVPDQMHWIVYDWKAGAYKGIEVPSVGETLVVPGPFDA